MAPDYHALAAFHAVAELQSFRQASERLGVTRSAVSQSVRRLEDRLGVALFQRTTRSVTLTTEGQSLFERLSPALDDISAAVEATTDRHDRPSGLLKLAVSSIADRFLAGPYLAGFLAAYPEIRLDLTLTDLSFDVVDEGFDAGVRLGEFIEKDMIAVPIAHEERQVAVCSPDYLAKFGAPAHPRDLLEHRCIGWRPRPDVAAYRWEFSEDGHDFRVDVDPAVTVNQMGTMVDLATCGAGITFGLETSFQEALGKGQLVVVLEEFCPAFDGFYLHYPSRRTAPPKLRALIDYVRDQRGRLLA